MAQSISQGMPSPWDPVEVQRRFEERYRQLGTRTPTCAVDGCVETNPFALTGTAPSVLCYQHRAESADRSVVERHHAAGQHNSAETVAIPGNDHRVLSELQLRWPPETLLNTSGSPLLAVAATLRGWIDVLRLLIDRTVGRIPMALEALNRILADHHGDEWWNALGWDGVTT